MSTAFPLRRALLHCALGMVLIALAPALSFASQQPLPTNATIAFLHHSTGGVIWDGGVPGWFTSHNATEGTGYDITAIDYPAGSYPWDNYPYDYWNIWVSHAGTIPYLGQATLEMLTAQYDVIVFKHCFPVSNIEVDTGIPDVTSPAKRLENYTAQYQALKSKLRSFPSNRFIIWTGAAKLQSEISEEMATRAKTFFDWVTAEWDEPGDNIYVWDFYDLETAGGIYLLPENGSADSHPNSTFAASVAPLFCQRIVDVIKGNGDANAADVPEGGTGLALALAGANPTRGPVSLQLSLPEASRVRLSIYDTAGRCLGLVADGDFPAGTRTLTWDHRAAGAAPGIYFAHLKAGNREVSRRFVIL